MWLAKSARHVLLLATLLNYFHKHEVLAVQRPLGNIYGVGKKSHIKKTL